MTVESSLAILEAATAYRDASKALSDHLAAGRPSWKSLDVGVAPAVERQWRGRRLELTEAVSRARITLLETALR